jgi:hypothetical protein
MPTFHATVKTAEAQGRLVAFINTVNTELSNAVEDLANQMALIFSSVAPKGRTGRLGRNIRVSSAQGRQSGGRFGTGRQFAIIASAKDSHGFDYVGVSRFGHLKPEIVPDPRRGIASVVSTRRLRAPHNGHLPALRIPLRTGGEGAIYRHSVRGLQKDHDWVSDGVDLAQREADATARRLATKLETWF